MRIAVSGLGILSAAGRGSGPVLEALRRGHSGVGLLPLFDAALRVPVARVKQDNEALKAMLGLAPQAAVSRTALLGMVAAGDALSDALSDAGGEEMGLKTGLVNATSTGGMDLTELFFNDFARDDSRGRLRNVVGHECADSTRRIAERLGITGFTTTISTACSSSANAIILGAGLIRQGIVDRVVAGGADALCRFTLWGFNSMMILDPEPCRPFDRSRAGLNLGEGAGYVVLQREDTLTREPYGYLRGYANANDAFHQTASSATGEGAYRAMTGAIRMAGLTPADIDHVNAHGTGTVNNDASEAAAIRRVFGSSIPPLSSTKPYTGHTLAAAGGIEAVISLLAIGHGTIFPNLGFTTPMDDNAPVPQTTLIEGAQVRHVLSNSFGFGGNNSSLLFSAC